MTDLDPEYISEPVSRRENVKSWFVRYERHLSALSIIAAFIVDSTTLVRVDFAITNAVLILYLCVAALGNLLINLRETGGARWLGDTAYAWLLVAVQFSYGGLFGRFLIYYSRSGSIFVSWPFLLLLLLLLVGNEFAKRWYAKITLHMAFLYLALYLYLTFAVPVLLNGIGVLYFLLAGFLSLLIMHWYGLLLRRVVPLRYLEKRDAIRYTVLGIFVTVNILYFMHVIPPLPLSIRDAGVFQELKQSGGVFVAKGEERTWRTSFSMYPEVHLAAGKSLYVFSSVFAPADFKLTIAHVWEKYDEKGGWVTVEKIPFTISGGREDGYRGHTFKRGVDDGRWRVSVETSDGQIVGRIGFTVVRVASTPTLIQYTY